MAYFQRNVPSPNKVHTFSLQNFSGGLNNRSELLSAPETPDVLNMTFSNDTVMEKRKGSVYLDELNITDPITFLDEFRPYDTGNPEKKMEDVLLRATDKKLYAGNEFLIDVEGRVTGANIIGKYMFVDGKKIRSYGKFPQVDTVYEKITGTPVDALVLFEVVKPPVDFTPLDETHKRGVARYNYTDKKMWYEPCKLEIEDTYQGSNVLPENPKYAVLHKGRFFVSGMLEDNDNVFMTDLNNPYYFPVYLPIQLPPNSDKVHGIHVFDDSLVIGRKYDMYVITGITNRTDGGEPFRLKKLNAHTGFASHDCVTTAHNYLFYFGSDGNAYALANTRTDAQTLATQVISTQIDIRFAPINLTIEDLADAVSVFANDMWYTSIKDKILIYSYRTRTWTMWNGLNARSYHVQGNELIWGDDKGRVSKHSDDYLDNKLPYVAHWKSMWFDMDDANAFKWFKEFYVVAHTYPNVASDIKLTFEIDYVDVKEAVVIKNEVATWGRAKFGDRFITRDINQSLPFVIGRRGRAIRFIFTNGFSKAVMVEDRVGLDAIDNKVEDFVAYIKAEDVYVVYKSGTWASSSLIDLNQGMKIYEVNGDYEYRGKR